MHGWSVKQTLVLLHGVCNVKPSYTTDSLSFADCRNGIQVWADNLEQVAPTPLFVHCVHTCSYPPLLLTNYFRHILEIAFLLLSPGGESISRPQLFTRGGLPFRERAGALEGKDSPRERTKHVPLLYPTLSLLPAITRSGNTKTKSFHRPILGSMTDNRSRNSVSAATVRLYQSQMSHLSSSLCQCLNKALSLPLD